MTSAHEPISAELGTQTDAHSALGLKIFIAFLVLAVVMFCFMVYTKPASLLPTTADGGDEASAAMEPGIAKASVLDKQHAPQLFSEEYAKQHALLKDRPMSEPVAAF